MTMRQTGKSVRRGLAIRSATAAATVEFDRSLGDIRSFIDAARDRAARAVDSGIVGLYWNVDIRLRQDILSEKRAEYGNAIVATQSQELTRDYGQGFTEKALWRTIQFAQRFSRSGDCRGAVARIVLEPFRRAHSTQG
jgi:hypothetical protein